MNIGRLNILYIAGLLALTAGCNTQMNHDTIPPREISRVPALPITEIDHVNEQFPLPAYEQTLIIRTSSFLSEQDLQFHDLYRGKRLAFTSRWDDNSTADHAMKDLLRSYGVKGTFYLNAPYFDHDTGSCSDTADFTSDARKLQGDGFSIGSHALSHPFITMVNRNRMFTELIENRILWEAATDSPVLSHAFSFTDFRNDYEGDAVQRDLYHTMERSGLFHTPNQNAFTSLPSDMEFSPILPPDGLGDIQTGYDWMLTDPRMLAAAPVVSLSMHSWGYDENDLMMLRTFLAGIKDDDSLWHCSQNEYAVYRKGMKTSHITGFAASRDREGMNTYLITISRPQVSALNGDMPLSAFITGSPDDLTVECGGEQVALYEADGELSFDIPNSPVQRMPDRIEYLNEQEVPYLDIALTVNEDSIDMKITNTSEYELYRLEGALRLPLSFLEGISWFSIVSLAPGEHYQDRFPVTRNRDIIYQAGEIQAVLQLDLSSREHAERVRVYRSQFIEADTAVTDASLLANASILGPLPRTYEARTTERMFRYGLADETVLNSSIWEIDRFNTLAWEHIDASMLTSYPYLSPDYVPVRPNYFGVGTHAYLIKVAVNSATAQQVDIVCDPEAVRHMIVNGEETGFHKVLLQEGLNTLMWYHKNPLDRGLTYASVGSYLKLELPNSDQRAEGITFQPIQEVQSTYVIDTERIEEITQSLRT